MDCVFFVGYKYNKYKQIFAIIKLHRCLLFVHKSLRFQSRDSVSYLLVQKQAIWKFRKWTVEYVRGIVVMHTIEYYYAKVIVTKQNKLFETQKFNDFCLKSRYQT